MKTSTITPEQQTAIQDYLNSHHLPLGLGTHEEACSIAAINIALTGELTDKIPNCMSLVVGKWIIVIQDSISDLMRNSSEWKNLLPLAAGTGRNIQNEKARLNLILDWMWNCLKEIQPIADKYKFGKEWNLMYESKHTAADAADAADAAAHAAARTARAARAAAARAAARTARAARAAAARAAAAADAADADAADAAAAAAHAAFAADAADAADAAAHAARAADAAARAAANTADAADAAAAAAAYWKKVNPIALLKQLVEI